MFHTTSVLYFINLVDELEIEIKKGYVLDKNGNVKKINSSSWLANFFGEQAVFFLGKKYSNTED